MNFLRRLFASRVNDDIVTSENTAYPHSSFKTSNTYRFNVYPLHDSDKRNTIRFIESYLENQQLNITVDPLCHPANLDYILQQRTSFANYYSDRGMTTEQVIEHLAIAISIFLTEECSYKRYIDSNPENAMKKITLKSVKGQIVVSIYPFEFSQSVLNNETSFIKILDRI
jgi:hypothetical protein